MLRLAHRLFRTARVREQSQFNRLTRDTLREELPLAQVMIADNIAAYAASMAEKPDALAATAGAAPSVPPFDLLFIEYDTTPLRLQAGIPAGPLNVRQYGVLLRNVGAKREQVFRIMSDNGIVIDPAEVEWIYEAIPASSNHMGEAGVYPAVATIFYDKNGHHIERAIQAPSDNIHELTLSLLKMVSLTLTFAHCKNVSKVDVTDTAGPTKKWCRRMRVPELKYHALQIDPNLSAKPRVASAAGGEDRSGKALHICRGHFRTYAEGGPGLFGSGRTGTFWVPSHTRGSSEHGSVTKDYTIGVPAA